MIYGNWADLMIGYWSANDVVVNPYAEPVANRSDSVPGGGVTLLSDVGRSPGYRAAIMAGSMVRSSQMAATVSCAI